ncbi:hypothetical protein HDU86_002418 [Geranomyces michiganensis]|nr:hypothetical protein HDU86_002418 [Geranomyces michiganensis]
MMNFSSSQSATTKAAAALRSDQSASLALGGIVQHLGFSLNAVLTTFVALLLAWITREEDAKKKTIADAATASSADTAASAEQVVAPHGPVQATIIPSVTATVDAVLHVSQKTDEDGNQNGISVQSATAALENLVAVDGAGSWPPRYICDEHWPSHLRAYAEIARRVPSKLAVLVPSTDDDANRATINAFRTWLTEELACAVNLPVTMSILDEITSHANADTDLHRIVNSFLSCVDFLRHAYRWGTVPIVRVAQRELDVALPEALDNPSALLHRFLGIEAEGGVMQTMTYSNVLEDSEGSEACDIVWATTRYLPSQCHQAERMNVLIFWEMERLALPMYRCITLAVDAFIAGNVSACDEHLETANAVLRDVFKHFYATVTEMRMSSRTWMSHAQGFHGWSNRGVEGVSGNQALVIRTLDAFLELPDAVPPHLLPSASHLSRADRTFITALRASNFRHTCASRYPALEAQLSKMATSLRIWRSSHVRKMKDYESVDLPERDLFTAGGGNVLADKYGKEPTSAAETVAIFAQRLETRIKQTK